MIGTVSGLIPLNRSMILNRQFFFISFLIILFYEKDLFGQDLFNFDESLSSVIKQSTASNIGVADINNDGINDLVVSGFDDQNEGGLFLDIYNVTTEGTLDTFQLDIVSSLFGYIREDYFSYYIGGNGGLDLGDFDNDGLVDILFHGAENLFLSKNLGSSVSTNNYLPSYVRENLVNSSAQWGDINLDGNLDIFWAGIKVYQNKPYITNKLLLNSGDDFEFETMVMPDLHNGAVAWSDIDLDGDLDLLISGESVNTRSGSTRLYKNDPLGRLAEDTNQEIIALKATSICFSDLDQDSDPDLVLSGWDPIEQTLKTVVYINEPTGTFRLADQQINFGTAFGTIEAIDVNLDGWKDLAISGGTEHTMVEDSYYDLTNIQTTSQGDTLSADTVRYYEYRDSVSALGGKIFLNEASSNISFNESQTFNGTRTISFSDINQDNIPDLVCSGTTEIGQRDSAFVAVYINTIEGTNSEPDPPDVLESFAISNRAIFNWGNGSDTVDPDQSLQYNLKIGTSSGASDHLSSGTSFNSPNIGPRLIREFTNIPWGTYYWSVQTVDASGIVSSWSQENELFIPRIVNSTQSLPGYSFGVSRWSDINDDDLLDISISGNLFSGSSLTQIFMNQDGLLEPSAYSGSIKNTYGGHISFADYTNDGKLDISLSGFHTSDWNDTYPATFFYKLTDNGYAWDGQAGLQYYAAGYEAGYLGGYNNHDWGDYDNDGDLDLAIGGVSYYGQIILGIYNNHGGILSLDTTQTNLVPGYPMQTKWSDINNDGHVDLFTSSGQFIQSYLNDGNGIMLQSEDHFIALGIVAGGVSIADFNSDGYDDFVLAGQRPDNGSLITHIYKNNNGDGFILHQELQGASYGGLDWGDYDNDGDLDFIGSGTTIVINSSDTLSFPVSNVYQQNSAGNFVADTSLYMLDSVGFSSIQWGDYDNDGDLDLLMNGELANKDLITKVYENLESVNNANVGPSRPVMLLDSVSVDTVRLSWNNSVDLENPLGAGKTPTAGIRYQLQMGGDQNYNLYANTHSIISGKYGTGTMGTLAKNNRLIKSIPEGRYQWRVRAMDYGLGVSAWSDWDYFYIDQTAPVVETIQANYGVSGQIILVVNFAEEFEMDNDTPAADPYVYATHPDMDDIDEDGVSDTLLAVKQSYSADVWTGLLTLPERYIGKAIKIHVSNATDMRGNTMVSASFFKTPEKIISQAGGTVISSDGNVSVLFPQNAVSEDISVSISLLNTSDTLDSNAISNYYTITPSEIQLNKPTILRIAVPSQFADLTGNNYNPYIGHINISTGAISPLGGSIISVNNIPYIQSQLSELGIYGAFRSDSTINVDSLDIEKIICQPRIFSPAGSVFEFPHTNILFDLTETDNVTARIFNLSGKIKRTLKPEQKLGPGNNIIVWDGKDADGSVVPSGLYIVTLESSSSMLKTTVGVLNR